MIRISETNCRNVWPPRSKVVKDTKMQVISNSLLTMAATPRGQGTPVIVDDEGWLLCQVPYLGRIDMEWVDRA